MLDEKDPDADRKIAERVITNHRCQTENVSSLPAFNYQQGDHIIEPNIAQNKAENSIFEKNLQKTTDEVTR